MGQKQFLYVILLIIFSGIVMVFIMNYLDRDDDDSALIAVQADLQQIANAARNHYIKPALLGGGGKTFNGNGNGSRINWEELMTNAGPDDESYETEHGIYRFDEVHEQSITVIATIKDSRINQNPDEQNRISARICRDQMLLSLPNEPAPTEEECLAGE